jgi:hypothetical protein
MQVLDVQARHRSGVGDGVELHRLGVDDDDVLTACPARRGERVDRVEAGVAVLPVVQHGRALGEAHRVGRDALGQVEVAALADDLVAVGDLPVEHVPLGVGVVDARAAAPVGVEVHAQRGRAVLLVDAEAPLARAALPAGQLGGVPDVVVLVDELDVGSHGGPPAGL